MHGLNMRAHRAVICEFLLQERIFTLYLVETNIDVLSPSLATDLMGAGFDYVCLPSMGASGRIMVAWSCDVWVVTDRTCRSFSVMVSIAPTSSPSVAWMFSSVYGLVLEELKSTFLDEIHEVHTQASGPFLICSNFNQI
jgi:hypothetical protein